MSFQPRKKQVKQPSTEDASTIWSTWMQPAEVLDVTREQRFRDEVRGVLWPVLGLREGGIAVDVGSGSGALTRALARWMGPGCLVYGVDRDTNFVAYARQRAKETRLARRTRYLHGEALALPLPDDCADAVTSYTVISHIPDHHALLREQLRVCKPGGRVSVMEVRSASGFSSSPPGAAEPTEREQELWKLIKEPEGRSLDDQWQIGKFNVDPAGLPVLLEEVGLREVMVDAFCAVTAYDDVRSRDLAERGLETEERMAFDNIDLYGPRSETPLSGAQAAELRRLVKARFAKRRRYLLQGKKLWDYGVGVSLVVSGRKVS
jgi:ubiquinone/menaquinone biosynthesis C-methylase UbiE